LIIFIEIVRIVFAILLDWIIDLRKISGLLSDKKPDSAGLPGQLDLMVRGNWVGREREMNEAGLLWQRALSGQGQVILISGEPGVGKTRFVRELASMTASTGVGVITGECYLEGGAPYAPLSQMIGDALEIADRTGVNLPDKALCDLLPILPSQLSHVADSTPGLNLDPHAQQQRIFEGFVSLCSTISERGPLLLFIDDVHWADTGTLFLLRNLARRGRKLPVLIVMTYREAELVTAPVLNELLVDLNHERLATHFRLASLDRNETQDLITSILAGEVTSDFLDLIFQQTEGNPFYVEEVCKALIEAGQLSFKDGRWHYPAIAEIQIPQTVRAAIQARLQKLPESSQDVLRMAAILGGEFDFETLKRAAGLDEDDLITALESALHAQLITEVKTGKMSLPRFGFMHVLIPTTLRESIIHVRRQRLHERAAQALEAVHPDDFELLAYHYAQAGQPERAQDYFVRAGKRAEQTAPGDATRFYRAALELWPADEQAGRAEILARLGNCLWMIDEIPEALKCFEAAYSLFARMNNRTQCGEMQRSIGRMHWERAERDLAEQHYHQALAILEDGPETPELARAISSISQMYMLMPANDLAIAWGQRALAMAERLGAEDIVVESLNNIASGYNQEGNFETGIPIARESLKRALAAGLPMSACRANYNLVVALQRQCNFVEAREQLQQLLAYARQVYAKSYYNLALWRLMWIEWLTGHWSSALVYRSRMVESSNNIFNTWAKKIDGMIDLDLDRLNAARLELEETLPSALRAMDLQTTVTHLGQLARAYGALGLAAKTDATIKLIIKHVSSTEDYSEESIVPLLIVCQQLATLRLPDSLENAQVCLSLLEKHTQRYRTSGAAAAFFEARGYLTLAEGHPHEAAEFFQQAAANWETIDRVYDQARAEGSLGQVLKATGDPAGATAAYKHAFDIFESLAAQLDPDPQASFLHSPLVEDVRQAVAGLSHTTPREKASPEFDILTEREVEVLKLVAQGLKNAQIAEMLVISPLTVNAHLRSIYNKLDVATRTAAVHRASEHGLI
jgi:predicted ATPase/DNA-binding CsgD family transcriptional regulator